MNCYLIYNFLINSLNNDIVFCCLYVYKEVDIINNLGCVLLEEFVE